jgi:phytanoyl-CoA hydroxylase
MIGFVKNTIRRAIAITFMISILEGTSSNRPLMTSNDTSETFERDGFAEVKDLIQTTEVENLLRLYDRFLDGSIEVGSMRADLGAGSDRKDGVKENITQIMWPSEFVPVLHDTPAYQNALRIVREMLGEDMDFDFDMLIDKAPHSGTATPWHQDCAYWPDLPDKRAASCWIALDEATLDNGCMWFAPGSQNGELRPHNPAGKGGGALQCDGNEDEARPVPLPPGACTFHGGKTLHYSRGNTTDGHRRALILNFRPTEMIRLEREKGFDHGKSDNVRRNRNVETK